MFFGVLNLIMILIVFHKSYLCVLFFSDIPGVIHTLFYFISTIIFPPFKLNTLKNTSYSSPPPPKKKKNGYSYCQF